MSRYLFNRDFYPTPENVIEQMMQFSDVSGKVVLGPSAGSGNIVDWCKKMGAKQMNSKKKRAISK